MLGSSVKRSYALSILNCGVETILAGCVQWSIASFVWNVEVTVFPTYENLDSIQVTMFRSSMKRSFALSIFGM